MGAFVSLHGLVARGGAQRRRLWRARNRCGVRLVCNVEDLALRTAQLDGALASPFCSPTPCWCPLRAPR